MQLYFTCFFLFDQKNMIISSQIFLLQDIYVVVDFYQDSLQSSLLLVSLINQSSKVKNEYSGEACSAMDARQRASKPGTCHIQCVCNTVITFKSICKFALSLVGVWKNLSKYVCLDVRGRSACDPLNNNNNSPAQTNK